MNQRLPVVTAREVLAALRRAGFVVDRVAGNHYLLKHPDDPRRVVTVPFHGTRALKTGTFRNIVRQSGLTVEKFRDLL